jgi:hypothetical protein
VGNVDDEGDDAVIVRRVGGDVEDSDAVDAGDGVTDGGDDLGTTAFGEIRDALDEFHVWGADGETLTILR